MNPQLRRQARELTLQILFQLEFAPDQNLTLALNYFKTAFQADLGTWDYANQLLKGIQNHRLQIDASLQALTSHWKLDRLALVDLNVLRIASYEIQYGGGEVPPPVVINEAIEIAKKYGSTDSGKFVNGVLDQLRKNIV